MPVPTITFLPNPGATSVRQVNPGNAAVDFGTVALAAKRAPIVSTEFSIRIDGVSPGSGRAIVWAFLEDPDPSVTIRIDGVRLSTVPQVVESQAVFGIPSGHSLYFEISVSAPAGRIDRTILWEVTQS